MIIIILVILGDFDEKFINKCYELFRTHFTLLPFGSLQRLHSTLLA